MSEVHYSLRKAKVYDRKRINEELDAAFGGLHINKTARDKITDCIIDFFKKECFRMEAIIVSRLHQEEVGDAIHQTY